MNYYIDAVFFHYSDFNGKSTRKEFWMFMLWDVIFDVLYRIIISIVIGNSAFGILSLSTPFLSLYFFVAYAYTLFRLIPFWAILTRRLHDVGEKSSTSGLICFPIVNLYIIYLLLKPSQPDSGGINHNIKQSSKPLDEGYADIYNPDIPYESQNVACAVCKFPISLADEAAICKHCNMAYHVKCITGGIRCFSCGNDWFSKIKMSKTTQ